MPELGRRGSLVACCVAPSLAAACTRRASSAPRGCISFKKPWRAGLGASTSVAAALVHRPSLVAAAPLLRVRVLCVSRGGGAKLLAPPHFGVIAAWRRRLARSTIVAWGWGFAERWFLVVVSVSSHPSLSLAACACMCVPTSRCGVAASRDACWDALARHHHLLLRVPLTPTRARGKQFWLSLRWVALVCARV